MVTPDIVSDVIHAPRVAHPDYPVCDLLKTVSKDELISSFYKRSFIWVIINSLLVRPLLKVLGLLTWL